MGFEEFLAEGSLNYILALMMVPLGIALLLVGYLVFAWRRRRDKSKMKLGMNQPSDTIAPATDDDSAAASALTESEVSPMASSTGFDDLDLGPLSQKPKEPETSPPSPEPDSEPATAPPPSAPTTTEPPEELLRLLRDPATGQLIVAVGSQKYYRLTDITDKKIGQFVLNVAAHFLAFTNGVIATDAGVKPVYSPKVGRAPEPVVKPVQASVEPLVPPPSPEAEAAFLASLQSFTPSRPEPARTRSGLFGSRRPAPAPDEPLQLNLADEINDLVQARLRQSSLAKSTTIDITSALTGGIIINVNGKVYDSPNEVTDETARDIIKSAIKEWESR